MRILLIFVNYGLRTDLVAISGRAWYNKKRKSGAFCAIASWSARFLMGALFVCGFPLSGFFDPVFAALSVVGPLCLTVGSIGMENIISGLVFKLLCG